jgi:hypothetical protein
MAVVAADAPCLLNETSFSYPVSNALRGLPPFTGQLGADL